MEGTSKERGMRTVSHMQLVRAQRGHSERGQPTQDIGAPERAKETSCSLHPALVQIAQQACKRKEPAPPSSPPVSQRSPRGEPDESSFSFGVFIICWYSENFSSAQGPQNPSLPFSSDCKEGRFTPPSRSPPPSVRLLIPGCTGRCCTCFSHPNGEEQKTGDRVSAPGMVGWRSEAEREGEGGEGERETDRMKTSPRAPFDFPSSISSVFASCFR